MSTVQPFDQTTFVISTGMLRLHQSAMQLKEKQKSCHKHFKTLST